MDTVGAFEAKTKFASLLKRVAGGESVTITRHGTPVARLVPVGPVADREKRAEAIRRIKELAKRNTLGGLSLKELIEEGRM
jgi:prevent-host-death family protein